MYLTDTFGINKITFLTVSARYNYAQTQTRDNTGLEPQLNGDNTFSRVTPAIGLNWNPTRAFNTYISYNEGMRVPTPAELTCADPTAPCKLPNAFLADPPLEPVLAKTFELGTRGAHHQYAVLQRKPLPHQPVQRYPVRVREQHRDDAAFSRMWAPRGGRAWNWACRVPGAS